MQNKLCLKIDRQTFWRYRKLSKQNGYDNTFLNQLLDDWENQLLEDTDDWESRVEEVIEEKPKKTKSSKKK